VPHSHKQARSRNNLDRREFVARSTALVGAGLIAPRTFASEATAGPKSSLSHQAMGTKVGEVSDTSAIVWTRLTQSPERNNTGKEISKRHKKRFQARKFSAEELNQLGGACPGMEGRVRLLYGTRKDLADAQQTGWVDVSAKTDFSHQFELAGLSPATVYHYATETTAGGGSSHGPLRGRFKTAPAVDQQADVTFCVNTCLMYCDLDHPDGFHIFPAMQKLSPDFVAFTGDNVYYDTEEPRAITADIARYHWQRMYSLPRHKKVLGQVATYWEKDDHDSMRNDDWPSRDPLGQLTFAEGCEIFRQQVPLVGPGYRTFRWGKNLQIWLCEGRDYRSSNNLPDGPDKTIWGTEQKAWLKETLLDSDARWKVLIHPTPIVGPDRSKKNDNHANTGFTHEGDEFRHWVQKHLPDNFFVVGGDRHWQYHSVHPETGVHEFGCGPASDQHAQGSPGYDERYHRFHRMKGGFLSVVVEGNEITFRHHNVKGKVVYQWSPSVA